MEKVYLKHEDMVMGFSKGENVFSQTSFDTNEAELENFHEMAKPMFQLAVAGEAYGFNPGLVTGQTKLPREMKFKEMMVDGDTKEITYIHERLGLEVTLKVFMVPHVNMMRCVTSVKNIGQVRRVITHLSSIFLSGIAFGGLLSWDDKNKIKAHYCMQTWNGEGQWRTSNLEELGIYKKSLHQNGAAFHLASVGSWSTGRFAPTIVLEDLECNKVWYLQAETSANWHIELGFDAFWDGKSESLYLQADGADEKFGGFSKALEAGEEFSSISVSIGCCNGGFEDGMRALTEYRRNILKPKMREDYVTPLVFNDYMNCLWGSPTIEKELPLIDAAAETGMEVFCIDAGWYINMDNNNWATLGDWMPGNRFGEAGLQFVLDYIISKGMIPGLWLEIEMCSENAELYKKPDSWFLRRYGIRVGGGDRVALNFANDEVRSCMHAVVDRLVDMGVGYFKNDYNLCVGAGDDTNGSAADGLLAHIRGFYTFIDEVREKHPTLVLENCASGALREDYGILSRFDLQSISDQEKYTMMPSIISGSLANVLPEQLGIWAYPYPHEFFDRDNLLIFESPDYNEKMCDGEQTIFNMVNGLVGSLYLSGRIDMADDLNSGLIKEAIYFAKKQRSFISNAYPMWPDGMIKIGDHNKWGCMGLYNEDYSRILLAVWRLSSSEDSYRIHIKNTENKRVEIKQVYPLGESFGSQISYHSELQILEMFFEKPNTARLFEIVIFS